LAFTKELVVELAERLRAIGQASTCKGLRVFLSEFLYGDGKELHTFGQGNELVHHYIFLKRHGQRRIAGQVGLREIVGGAVPRSDRGSREAVVISRRAKPERLVERLLIFGVAGLERGEAGSEGKKEKPH
jgi:hypothetical protein